jgi:hypothetical protein
MSKQVYKILNSEELSSMSLEKINWLVEGLLPAIGTSIIGAPPKSGKSTLARQLCVVAHNGHPFLGRESVKGNALYFSTQESPKNIVSHFNVMGYDSPEMIPPVISERQPDRQRSLDLLDNTLEANPGFKLVVIDMIIDFLPVSDANDYEEVRKVFAGIAALAEKHRLHIAVTHHSKKVKQENSVHDLLGSTAMAGAVDQVIMISVDRQKNRYITTSQRYGKDIEERVINWKDDRMMMFLGKAASEIAQEQKDAAKQRVEQAVLTYVVNNPDCSRDDVLAGVTGDASTKLDALKLLEQTGMIQKAGTGKRGDRLYFRETQLQAV